jgi:hypothetical protein
MGVATNIGALIYAGVDIKQSQKLFSAISSSDKLQRQAQIGPGAGLVLRRS